MLSFCLSVFFTIIVYFILCMNCNSIEHIQYVAYSQIEIIKFMI